MKEAIAKVVSQTLAYKTTEINKVAKFQEVERIIAIHPAFRDLVIKPTSAAIQKEFKRMTKEILIASGTSKEGANVSALADAPTDHEQLLMDMAEENEKAKADKENEKEKKRKVQQALFGHEIEGLRAQGFINMDNSLGYNEHHECFNDDEN